MKIFYGSKRIGIVFYYIYNFGLLMSMVGMILSVILFIRDLSSLENMANFFYLLCFVWRVG